MTTDEPAVNGWQAATEAHMARSTSAELRQVTADLDRLREQYDALLLERDAIGARLCDALDANTALSFDHAKALIAVDRLTRENERLTARIARQRGAYQLTDLGRAATQTTEEQP